MKGRAQQARRRSAERPEVLKPAAWTVPGARVLASAPRFRTAIATEPSHASATMETGPIGPCARPPSKHAATAIRVRASTTVKFTARSFVATDSSVNAPPNQCNAAQIWDVENVNNVSMGPA